MPKKIIVSYVDRDTNCPMGTRYFVGKNCDVLAANYQSAHPELKEVKCEIIR